MPACGRASSRLRERLPNWAAFSPTRSSRLLRTPSPSPATCTSMTLKAGTSAPPWISLRWRCMKPATRSVWATPISLATSCTPITGSPRALRPAILPPSRPFTAAPRALLPRHPARAPERGLERELERGLERELEREAERGLERELERGLERELEAEAERAEPEPAPRPPTPRRPAWPSCRRLPASHPSRQARLRSAARPATRSRSRAQHGPLRTAIPAPPLAPPVGPPSCPCSPAPMSSRCVPTMRRATPHGGLSPWSDTEMGFDILASTLVLLAFEPI